ncbi:hypothetical protein AKJ62_01890 [candidate division MSBL1 archaeon SCGC-AAA259D14]|uniref:Uncharacterized protein n=2 Tax=candidate division MSBL1 TaxID=215777 RepID=A0A133USL1_9EURY|nr:hypothetical protein AKJ62_01890 [candidate division MSBL1 archaeon SCGC-AAA259D14]KXA97178.1 hypothetical protein AKJ38_01790 [candidate division MSBL1 archaeon SCGC-AAA259I14]
MKEETVKIELCKWEIGDLIGILNRHVELLQNELESTDDQSEEWMLRTQKDIFGYRVIGNTLI